MCVFILDFGLIPTKQYFYILKVDETFGVMGPMKYVGALMSSSDFITSLIVARKGLGDMVVSSNLGSNIFTMTLL